MATKLKLVRDICHTWRYPATWH